MNIVEIDLKFSTDRADHDHITRNAPSYAAFETEDDARSFFAECREAIEKIKLEYKDRFDDIPF